MTIKTDKKAIIDIGSNTIRLVVYSYSPSNGLVEHHNFKMVARLSMYIQQNGELSEDGIIVLIETLKKFKEILLAIQVDDVFAAATAAIRQASNREEIVALVEKEIGFQLMVLSTDQEAYFGYLAVTHTTNIHTAVTIDMGGGSTEVTYFENKKLIYSHSFPFGAVSLKSKFIKGSMITSQEIKNLGKFIQDQFESLEWLKDLQVPIIAIGGSARNIVQVDQQRKNFGLNGTHQYELKRKDLAEISEEFAACSLEDLKKIDGLSSDRADIILPALETFRVFMDVIDSTTFSYSKKGLREGIIITQLMELFPTNFNVSEVTSKAIRQVLGKFGVMEESALHLYDIFYPIYTQFCEWGYIEPLENEAFLQYAYQLFHIGEHIDRDGSSQHTFYLLTNITIDGLSNKERLRLALLASFKNRNTFKKYVDTYPNIIPEEEYHQLRDIGALIKFVHGIDVLGKSNIRTVTLKRCEETINITFHVSENYLLEKYHAEKFKKHVEKISTSEVIIEFDMEETINE